MFEKRDDYDDARIARLRHMLGVSLGRDEAIPLKELVRILGYCSMPLTLTAIWCRWVLSVWCHSEQFYRE